jgi:hypothetical protein
MKKLINLTQEVKTLLTTRPALRDNNRKLCIAVWKREAKRKRLEPSLFFENYERGSLTTADNITRCARRVKEENAELRGYNHTSNKKKEQIAKKIFRKK